MLPPTQQSPIDYARVELQTRVSVPERTHACTRTYCVSIALGRPLCACQQWRVSPPGASIYSRGSKILTPRQSMYTCFYQTSHILQSREMIVLFLLLPYTTILELVRCEFPLSYNIVFISEVIMYGEMSGYKWGRKWHPFLKYHPWIFLEAMSTTEGRLGHDIWLPWRFS